MGALLGLLLGLGLLLVWRQLTASPPSAAADRPAPVGWLRRWEQRRRELLRRAGVTALGVWSLSAVQVAGGAAATLASYLVTGAGTVAACFGVFGAAVPILLVRRRRLRRSAALREVWPEAVDNLASAVRAGLSLPEALSGLAIRGPIELRAPFGRFAAFYRASGRFGPGLDTLRDDLADPVGDRVCETLRVAREVGGSDLGTVLRTLSELLRSDARARAELETRQGWVVNAARLAVGAPWAVLLLLGTRSSALASYDSAGGALLLGIGAGVCALAYRLMLRLGRLPEEQRVLA